MLLISDIRGHLRTRLTLLCLRVGFRRLRVHPPGDRPEQRDDRDQHGQQTLRNTPRPGLEAAVRREMSFRAITLCFCAPGLP
jgi:hypothetical protein